MHKPRYSQTAILTCLLLLVALLPANRVLAGSNQPDAPLVPADNGSIYWGAYINGVPFDMSLLDRYERLVGKGISIVHWGEPWMMNGEFMPFQKQEMDEVRQHGAIPMVNWNSWHLGGGIDQPDFQLRDIYEGDFDAYIRQWARAARDWGYPFFLRFNHEMNGRWFPWAESMNGNAAGDFVKAWRHVYNLFQSVGAHNVTWVWCVNVVGNLPTEIEDVYPGDAYVDWLAMDGYNGGPSQKYVWESFTPIFKETYDALMRLSPGKPVMIAEFASTEYTGSTSGLSKAAWIRDALQKVPVDFPAIKAVVWFNWNARDSRLTWPIESSTAASQAFASGIQAPVYAENRFTCLRAASRSISPLAAPLSAPDLANMAIRLFMPVVKPTGGGC